MEHDVIHTMLGRETKHASREELSYSSFVHSEAVTNSQNSTSFVLYFMVSPFFLVRVVPALNR